MPNLPSRFNTHFWTLAGLSVSLVSLGLVFLWRSSQNWLTTFWYLCQAGVDDLALVWPLVMPVMLLIVLLRGGSSAVRQVRATLRLKQIFYPLRTAPPPRLRRLLTVNRLPEEQVVFLDVPAPHAFCAGFWRPRIWLTTGLVDLLTDEELEAVLVHEAQHRRQRDPLRLVISRALGAAFFFLPAVQDLAQAAELEQEVAADQAAIAQIGDDLPLLCAIQKLLRQGPGNVAPEAAVYSPFNVTEARLRRLIATSPSRPPRRTALSKWGLNLAVLAILAGLAFLSTRPVAVPAEITSCSPASNSFHQTQTTWLNYH